MDLQCCIVKLPIFSVFRCTSFFSMMGKCMLNYLINSLMSVRVLDITPQYRA